MEIFSIFSQSVCVRVWCVSVGVGVFTKNNVGNAVEMVMRHPWGRLLFQQRSLLGFGGGQWDQLLCPDWESSLIERCPSTSRIDTQSQRTVLATVHVVRQRTADDDKRKGEWWEEGGSEEEEEWWGERDRGRAGTLSNLTCGGGDVKEAIQPQEVL